MKSLIFSQIPTLLLIFWGANCNAAGHPQPQQQMPSGAPVHNFAPASRPQAVAHPNNFTHHQAPVGNNASSPANNNWHPNSTNSAVNNNHPVNNANNNNYQHHFNHHNNNGYFYNNVAVPYYYSAPVDDDDSYVEPEDENTENDQSNLPGNAWASAGDGEVPQNAVSYQDNTGMTVYYCRALYNSTEYYGYLVPDDGCYVDDQSTTLRFEQYEVLVQE